MSPLFHGCLSGDPLILANNEDMHKSLDEYEFRPDPITDYGVSCPWAAIVSERSTVLHFFYRKAYVTKFDLAVK